jgi:hypothetical protein
MVYNRLLDSSITYIIKLANDWLLINNPTNQILLWKYKLKFKYHWCHILLLHDLSHLNPTNITETYFPAIHFNIITRYVTILTVWNILLCTFTIIIKLLVSELKRSKNSAFQWVYWAWATLSVAVEWLGFLLQVWEDLSSNLGYETGYAEWADLELPHSLSGNGKVVP